MRTLPRMWLLFVLTSLCGNAWATWSIVLADTNTREVALGTTTCVANLDLLAVLPVIVVEKGAAAVQASGDFDGMRRPIIFQQLMLDGDPADMLTALSAIAGHESRQYGIVNTLGQSITFTGASTFDWAGGVTGSQGALNYAIQGNILTGQCVVDAIEQAILNTAGDIPEKLMAGMQAASAMGGDGRCSCSPAMPTSCGCPVPNPGKSGHIGGLIVARPGDVDDVLCDLNGCADGDYFMFLNVAGQAQPDPDPVTQLQGLFDSWRNDLIGRPDAGRSTVSFDPPAAPPNGSATITMRVTLLDWQDQPITAAINTATITHTTQSDGLSTIGPATINPDGTIDVPLTANTLAGTDQFIIDVDDGTRPVRLMPESELTYFDLGDINGDGFVNLIDLVSIVSNAGACPSTPSTCLEDLNGDSQVDPADTLIAASLWK